jgi:glycosyltransferase involved in cell wall biosynthesis
MRAVHFIVPAGIDDPARPSGGNVYDRRISSGLAAAGWAVQVKEVAGSWPWPDQQSLDALADAVGAVPDGALVLFDGLVASLAPEVLCTEAGRLRLVVLVHMPLGYGATNGGALDKEGAVLSEAASVITTSAWARRALLELYPLPSDRVHIAEPGVDSCALASGTETSGAFLSVAAVIPGKGHDVLLDALEPLVGLCWQCECVGSLERDPAFVQRLRRRVSNGGMDDRVRFSGTQATAQLANSYAAADVLVVPSRAETYGMVIAEALARGLPVVAAEVGGVPEAMGRGADGTRPGLLVPPDDPAALRNALRAWLEDSALRERLRAAARERRTSLLDWSTTASTVAEVLQGALR